MNPPMYYTITKRVPFSAAHSLKGAGKCENKHGHNWVANITIVGDQLDNRGFVADIADVKQAAFKYDHDDLDNYFEYPSTELVAQKIAEDALDICINSNPAAKFDIDVHLIETENNSAYGHTSTLHS